MGSYKNNGNPFVLLTQLLLQFDSAHSGQAHIEYQARRVIAIVTGEKFFNRGKCSGRKAGRLHYASQRLSKGFVIIDDGDDASVGSSLVHFGSPNLRRCSICRQYETINRLSRKLSCFVLKNLML